MNELAAATGMPKSTILYYLGQGFLPKPRRTGRNMAYYDPACIERIERIRQMQERHRLTLSEIKRCLDDPNRGAGLGVYLDLNEEVFGPLDSRRLLDATSFCRETGLSAGQLDELMQVRLLLPLEAGGPGVRGGIQLRHPGERPLLLRGAGRKNRRPGDDPARPDG
jgi:predicted DNA-binding transcriptional regulator AlpA